MRHITSKLRQIGTTLAEALPGIVFHYKRPRGNFPWVTWQEDGAEEMPADNAVQEQAMTGTVDYFTLVEYDANIDTLQETLNGLMDAWRLVAVQFEEATGVIHYTWEWSITTAW